jgi:hypothetical protein
VEEKNQKRWKDMIEKDMRVIDVCIGDIENQD